jgi:hypothetical protein
VRRAASGVFTPTNPACAKTCIEAGTPAVFISEQAKAVYRVKGYEGVVNDLGYHVEAHGYVDASSGWFTVQRVVRLEYEGASCARPKKKAAAAKN